MYIEFVIVVRFDTNFLLVCVYKKTSYIVSIGNSTEKHHHNSYVFRCLVGSETGQTMR